MASQGDFNRIKRSDLKLVNKQPLGEGGFGSVYHMNLSKGFLRGSVDVAAKKLLRRDVGLHELEMLSGLDHPNIVKLIGVVDEDIEFMLILELCEGGSLRSYLDKGRRLTLKQFYDWLLQSALPLEFLKQKKLLHKDVKSPNYLITADKTLKLGDFGLARNIERTISNASETGSHPWMAPELLTDGKLSPKYDIFALGVVIWELWTGQYPHKGLEWQVIVMKVCNRGERLPIPDDCPEPIKQLIDRCWKTNWKDRPSIEEVISAITTAYPATQHQIMSGPWKLEREFGDQDGPQAGDLYAAKSIAVNPSNGDVAIAGRRRWGTSRVNVYSDHGEFKFSINTEKRPELVKTFHPRQVAISSCHDYMVTDGSGHMKIYDINGKFKDQWESSCSQESRQLFIRLWGLAIDSDGHVLVGDISNNHINTHRQDGTYLDSIKVGIKPRFIAVTSQDTIVIADWNKPPQIVSKTGQIMHTLKYPDNVSLWDPWGVYCHGDMILIGNQRRCYKPILCYSRSGGYLGHIPISDVSFPLAMTPDGKKLMVCEGFKVKVFSL
ncbi:uncharacterized protein [Amphiura filiformis]|uniref:uncharacterized protein n=1 Tax=Amphiura filiformis TaxID=82378 RepID=UPI003B20E62E